MYDYLAIGHITADVQADGFTVGGTVAYAARTAQALGCRTAVVTSAAPDFNLDQALPGIAVSCVPAATTTTFQNIYEEAGRKQYIHGVASWLSAGAVPASWRRTPIVHLGPVADEIDIALVELFSASMIGLTPQGWLRGWEEDGRIGARVWAEAARVLPLAAAVVISEEDLPEEAVLPQFRRWARLLVLTQGARGCTVFLGEEERHFSAPAVPQVNATGAGDVFAAAFFTRLYQTKGNPWEAAEFATRLAAHSVMFEDLETKMRELETVRD